MNNTNNILSLAASWGWLARAAELPGRALAVAICLALEAPSWSPSPAPVPHRRLRVCGVDRFAARRALRALQEAGLVRLRGLGRGMTVELLDDPLEPEQTATAERPSPAPPQPPRRAPQEPRPVVLGRPTTAPRATATTSEPVPVERVESIDVCFDIGASA